MKKINLDQGTLSFQTEGRLLQELGERLVASPEVALVELVKNAYDADSLDCIVHLIKKDKGLVIKDSGFGMTFSEFETRWMRIATSHKAIERVSRKYGRLLTGQKGIGRFAVRFLGNHLLLDTVAWDEKRKCKTRLVASFNWPAIDKARDLRESKIPYRLMRADDNAPTGTTLTVRRLKQKGDFARSKNFRSNVLKIVTPIQGLERGRFGLSVKTSSKDPGFQVVLPGDDGRADKKLDLAKNVLANAWAKLTIDAEDGHILYRVTFYDGTQKKLRVTQRSSISNGLFADIRFFPRRSGIFSGKDVKGVDAWRWVHDNAGVAVIDHGFRIKPYGYSEDDWLHLDADKARNEREWRSAIANKHFAVTAREKKDPAINPVLNLPGNLQLVGAVFVESAPASLSRSEVDLTPSMDREGFLKNAAFSELGGIVRGGLEYLADQDKKRILEKQEIRAEKVAKDARADFKATVEYIRKSPTLASADKARLIEEYGTLAKKLDEVEDYHRQARHKLEVMSSLGVVAGYLTHEATRIIASLGDALILLRRLSHQQPTLNPVIEALEQSYKTFREHVDYTRTFIDAVQVGGTTKFKAGPQIDRVIKKFGAFAKERGIRVDSEVAQHVEVPAMPVTVYSGVLLNLYTNALKAIIAKESSGDKPRIVFKAWNEAKFHVLEVLDTGIGIPPHVRNRIWDPLFTTTSRVNNPLGSGMGLGLSLVQQLVRQMDGHIEVVDPPSGFSTCFRVEFPWRKS